MVQYTCEICSKVFTKHSQYTNHKKRKTPCVPIARLAQNIHTPSRDNATPEEVFGVQHEPKQFDGTIAWKKTDDSVADDDMVRANSDKMTTLMKRCHQILYNNGGIVGTHAMKDIMKILMLKMLQPFFTDENSSLYRRVQHTLNMTHHPKDKEKFLELFETAKNIRMLMIQSYGDPADRWKFFVDRFLSRILPKLYQKSDYLNCRSDVAIIELILHIDKLDDVFITDAEKSGYDTICGQIYENFINGYMKGDKVLGQMFTPRNLVHLILDGVLKERLKDKQDMTIYDPCMGSGGFLCLTKRMMGDKVVQIIGSDIGKDPFSFAFFNVLMTTGRLPENLYCEDTLKCYRPEKADLIITNPPFALKVRYQQKNKDDNMSNGVKDMYDCFRGNRDDIPKFEEIYPFQTNSGVCLFIQHCIHKLKHGGICAIILPDGEVMTGGRGMANFRYWFCQNANIRCIVSVPAGVFEHVGVKTAVIVFEKLGSTSSIQFMQTNGLCDEIVKVCDVSVEHMGHKKYSFDPSVYLKGDAPIVHSEGIIVKTLGEVCDFQNGKGIKKSSLVVGEYHVIGGGQKPLGFHNQYNRDENTILCSSSGAYAGYISKYNKKVWASDCFSITPKQHSVLNNDYLYYILKSNQERIYKLQTGTAQPHVYSNDISTLKIPLPPIEKQKEISADCELLFTQIQTLKTLKEQIKTEKRLYKKYTIQRSLQKLYYTSPAHILSDVCTIEIGGTPRRDNSLYYNGGTHVWISVSELNNSVIMDSKEKITDLGVKNSNVKLLPIGTILYSFKLSIGKISIAGVDLYTNEAIAGINPKNKEILSNDFLYGVLKFSDFSSDANGMIGKGSLNKSSLSLQKIPVPDMDTQTQWIQRFVEYSSKLNEYENELNMLDTKIKSLESMMASCFE